MKAGPRSKTPARRRAAAAPLTQQRIVAAALEEIHADGLAAFSTRKLGQRLGCEAMSIYHHFPSKQHLLDALVAHAIGSVDVPEPGADPADNEARMRRCVYSYRAMARRWPALFPLVAVHRLNMPSGVRFIESILRLMNALLGDVELSARQFRTLGYYLNGACLDETAGYARGPSAVEPVDDALIERECPSLVAAAPYFKEAHWDATFELGLAALLDAGQAAAQARVKSAKGRKPARS